MRRSDIFFVLLVLILVVGIGLIPYIDGYLFKRDFLNLIASLNQQNRSHLNIEVMEYHLGWLKSKAKFRITYTDKEWNRYIMPGIIINDVISHGPLVFDQIQNKFGVAYATLQASGDIPLQWRNYSLNKNTQDFFQSYSRVNFDNSWDQQFQISPLNIPDLGIIRIQPSATHFKFTMDQGRVQEINSVSNIGSIAIETDVNVPNQKIQLITIQPFSIQHLMSRQANDLWNTKNQTAIPAINVQMLDGSSAMLNQVSMMTSKTYNADNFTSNVDLTIKNVILPSYSVISNVSTLHFTFALNNFSAQGLKDYMTFMRSTDIKQLVLENQTSQLASVIGRVLTPQSIATSTLNLNSSLGTFSLQAKAFWPSHAAVTTFNDLLANTDTDITIRAAIPLVEKVTEALFANLDATIQNASIQMNSQNQQINSFANPNNPYANSGENAAPSTENDPFKLFIAHLMEQGKLSLPNSIAMLNLEEQHVTLDAFTAKVKTLLPKDIADQLISAYQIKLTTPNTLPGTQASSTPVQQQSNSPSQLQPAPDSAEKLLDSWLQQGLIIKDNNDYVMSISSVGQSIKVNGKNVNQALPVLLHPGVQ